MDEIDRRILREIRNDASLSQRELAERVALSQNACWARLKKLHDAGIIRGTTTLLDPAKIGIGITVLVLIKTRHHSREWFEKFTRKLEADEEIVEFFRIAGDFDYVLKIMTRDVDRFDAAYKRLIDGADFETVSSYVVMGDIKAQSGPPLLYLF